MGKRIQSVMDYIIINRKKLLLKAMVIGSVILFYNPLIELYSTYIVAPILSQYKVTILSDIVLVLSILVYCSYSYYKIGKSYNRLLNYQQVFLTIVIVVIYSVERLEYSRFDYKHFAIFPKFNVADVLIFSVFSILIVSVFKFIVLAKSKDNQTVDSSEPIKRRDDDRLYRNEYASAVAKTILKQRNKSNSFAIGITGKWGEGKTSFANLIKEYLREDKDVIIIDFLPWYSSNARALIQDFFATLEQELQPLNPQINSPLKEYTELLLKYYDKNQSLVSLYNLISNKTGTLKDKFDHVKTCIEKIGRPIVISIDDLDRLDKEEIIEVIRLIRNTANFSRTIFLVSYDKKYVSSALKPINEYGSAVYLEKIFQQEIQLPAFPSTILKETLLNELKERVGDEVEIWLKPILFETPYEWPIIEDFFTNLRDVYRFVNTISIPLIKLKGDINETQFFYLQLLNKKYPEIYKLIEKEAYNKNWINSTYLTLKTFDYTVGEIIYLKTKRVETGGDIPVLQGYLQKNYSNDFSVITQIINILFPHTLSSQNKQDVLIKDHRQIFYEVNICRYFDMNVSNISIPTADLKDAFSGEIDVLTQKIVEWTKQGKHSTIEAYLRNMNEYKTKEQFEKHIKAIFIYANQPRLDKPNEIISFNFELTRELILKGRPLYSDEEAYKQIILDVVKSYCPNFLFNSRFLSSEIKKSEVAKDSLGNFPLEEMEMININVEHLREFLSSSKELKVQAFWMFHTCDFRLGEKNMEAAKLIKDFAAKNDMRNFLKYMVNNESSNNTIYSLSILVGQLFEKMPDEFEEFLITNNKNEVYYNEFMQFFREIQAENYVASIQFTFKELDVFRYS
ncbi:MAG: KAP family P-loop NTPase fold protein [Bacteroidales bacterium]